MCPDARDSFRPLFLFGSVQLGVIIKISSIHDFIDESRGHPNGIVNRIRGVSLLAEQCVVYPTPDVKLSSTAVVIIAETAARHLQRGHA